ncbi:uncharacterized protein UV8b_07689 [Ustilaginoidea virens]|uniref:DUF7907 domain-containing protein n=1 Tax=Ustilaginoidea virens TaxID=1159556 RepID=A0A8E5MKA4_USTVR|nr:uncharacterized protein UV8b_07689 [Ustilaginoidea virens]QUC23448.1 hypothetical protein UV8b_07689 [Ustilaginoidea virens]
MKTSALSSALAFIGLATAQEVQSQPFNLVIKSQNKELDGRALSTCHSGAAIESLCLLPGSKATFHLNTTTGEEPGPGGVSGALTWDLPAEPPIPSTMTFSIDPSTNVALPLFYPGRQNVQYVSFDSNDILNIVSYLDDTKNPPNGRTPRVLDNWYICKTYFGYTYTTLAWVLGNANPQNPSCVKVDVKRRFV